MILTDEEVLTIAKSEGQKLALGKNQNIDIDFARAIEAAVLEKLKQQEPVAYYTNQGNWPRIVLACDGNEYGYETPLYAAPVPAAVPELLEALKLYEKAFDGLFSHCLSNGVFNAWDAPLDCATLNIAHESARAAITKATGGAA